MFTHLFQARRAVVRLGNSADRARLYGEWESADHPGLVSLPGSASVLESPVVVFSSDREPCRRALSPKRGRGGTFEPQAPLRSAPISHCKEGHD